MWQRWKKPLGLLLLICAAAWLAIYAAGHREFLLDAAQRFWQTLVHVRLSYILLATGFIFLSYFFRSLRWRAFAAPMKSLNLMNVFVCTLIGFSAVALLGRPGELARPFLIARKENLTVSSQFAAWTLERIFDGFTFAILMGFALTLFPDVVEPGSLHARIMASVRIGGLALFCGALFVGSLLVQLRRNRAMVLNMVLWCVRLLPEARRERAHRFIGAGFESFADGLASFSSASGLAVSMFYSVLVWIPVVLAFWLVTRAFGPAMAGMNFGSVILLMAVTATGVLVQMPGIGGGFQVATVLAMTQLFRIPLEIATSAAMLLWLVGFLMVLVPGVPLAAREGLSFKRLRQITGAEGRSLDLPAPDSSESL